MNVYPIKCRIRAAGGTTRVDVYDDIGGGDWLFGGGISAGDFAGQLAAVAGPLDVHINSYGGDVDAGITIGNIIRGYQGRKRTVVDGFACSIASVILQAGDERVMQPGSMVMVHDAMSACVGSAADMRESAATLDKHSDNLAGIYAARAGGTAAQWRATMREKDTWYTADEAVAAGLADRVGDGEAHIPAGVDVTELAAMVPGRIAAALRMMPRAAASMAEEHGHPGQPCWDPDGDGDCDATPEGDTDHDYWAPDGTQLKPVPGKPMEDALAVQVRALVHREFDALIVQLSDWHDPATGAPILFSGQPFEHVRQVWQQYRNADKYDTEDRKRMAKAGHAMPDGSYPIADAEDLDNAIHAVGRGGADHDSIRAHIIKRAEALGLSSKIPDNWNADGSMKDLSEREILAMFTSQLGAGKE